MAWAGGRSLAEHVALTEKENAIRPTTGSDGLYSFAPVSGDYSLEVVLPADMAFALSRPGGRR